MVAARSLPPVRQYQPFPAAPFQIKMGLHKLELADWIEIDQQLGPELAQKRRLLTHHHDRVFVSTPSGEAGSRETLTLLAEHLVRFFPHFYSSPAGSIQNQITGESWSLTRPDRHPLEVAARLVQEDLCLMSRDPATDDYLLSAACVCFPSRWDVRDKLGLPINAIHTPVPHYGEKLDDPMNRLFARLQPQRLVWRLGWSVTDSPDLHQPPDHPHSHANHPITAQNAGQHLWLRGERQTLRRLPHSQDILFTIRVYVYRLDEIAQSAEQARHLLTALQEMDPKLRVYKGLDGAIQPAMAWLQESLQVVHEI